MEGDLIQLIEEDDDQLLEVSLSEPTASIPDPSALSSSAPTLTTVSRPPTVSASVAEASIVSSQPPSYTEANRCQPGRPLEGK